MKTPLMPTILFFAALGTLVSAQVAAEDTPRLPRAFEKAHLGMGMGELRGLHPRHTHVGSTQPSSTFHAVERPKDPYVKEVEYDFYNGRLAEITIIYKLDQLKGKVESFMSRLKQT